MVEFLKKNEIRGIKIAWVNSIRITKSINLQLFFGGNVYTPSYRIGKVKLAYAEDLTLHAEVARSVPGWDETAPIYIIHEAFRGYCPWRWGVRQSIGSTVSDTIVFSCMVAVDCN